MPILTKHRKNRFLNNCASITTGSLRLTTPDGERFDFGKDGEAAEMHIYDWSALTSRALVRSYCAGLWDSPDLPSLASIMMSNPQAFPQSALVTRPPKRLMGNEFYQLWLDPGMSFTSALFESGETDLSRAQQRKYDRVLDMLSPGLRLLDVGCGWGALAERAADRGHDVIGLTQSAAQKGYADARLDGRADIRRQDPRLDTAIYDNIVSLEHLNSMSPRQWTGYLQALKSRLAQTGRIVLQAVTSQDGQDHAPTQTYLRTLVSGIGLKIENCFAFGDSYARTALHWQDRLHRHSSRLSHLGFDMALQREWRFALATRSARFRTGQNDVLQMTLSHTPTHSL